MSRDIISILSNPENKSLYWKMSSASNWITPVKSVAYDFFSSLNQRRPTDITILLLNRKKDNWEWLLKY